MQLEFISRNKDGNYYVGYKIVVQRGIKGKTRSKANELIIIGVPKSKFKEFCKEHDIILKGDVDHGE